MQKEEDQMRREIAGVHALHQLQERMCFYPSGKEEESSQRVGAIIPPNGRGCTVTNNDLQREIH